MVKHALNKLLNIELSINKKLSPCRKERHLVGRETGKLLVSPSPGETQFIC